MSNITTIKVSKETLMRLHQFVGKLTQQRGRRVTLEEAISQLLDDKDKNPISEVSGTLKIDKDREAFISILDETFDGAGPEDFKEYDYEDLGHG